MPIYIYQNPITEEVIEVVQSMSEDHIYFDESGLKWKRVFVGSQLNTNATIDHWSSNDFVNKTANTKGSYGDLMDRSAELSEKRAKENGGVDPVKQNYFNNYSNSRKGTLHPKDPRKKKKGNDNIQINF